MHITTGPPTAKRLLQVIRVLAYLGSPAIPSVCPRIEHAISTLQCTLGVPAALLAQVGLVSVLGGTNSNPWQIFIVSLLGESICLIVLWQYLAGHAVALWSAEAERQWKAAGRFFGVMIALGLASAILTFHLQPR